MKDKIKKIEELSEIILKIKSEGKKIVHCHGVFDLLHIGHIKHFEEAKKLGDTLVVSITPDDYVNKGPGRPAFSSKLRLEALAALESIDYVVLNKWPSAEQIIKIIEPDVYCKGPDYKDHSDDITGKIAIEEEAVKLAGGKVSYTEGITFSSSSILNKYGNLFSQEQEAFIKGVSQNHSFNSISDKINNLKDLKVLVIGETIIDQYVFCEALGKSGKEPVLVLRDLETQEYLGGAIAIARHLASFCEEVSILSFLGENSEYKSFIEKNIETNIKPNFLTKTNSPTIIKKRFVDNIDKKKILGVYSINDDGLNDYDENLFLEYFEKISKSYDLVIVSDYGHGIITPKIASKISQINKFVSLNAQVNAANMGTHNIRKYNDIDCLIINETELRHEMRQRDGDTQKMATYLMKMINAKYITVTQGKKGGFLIDDDEKRFKCPGFAAEVVDKVGSGDALLALLSICLYNKIDEDLSLFIASIAAAQSVESIGTSKPVSKVLLLKTISHFLK